MDTPSHSQTNTAIKGLLCSPLIRHYSKNMCKLQIDHLFLGVVLVPQWKFQWDCIGLVGVMLKTYCQPEVRSVAHTIELIEI